MALTPTQLDKLPEPMIQLMSELQDEIISDICRRIKKTNLLTPTAEWQLIKANQLTLSSQEVKRRIAAKLKISEKSVKELYTDAVKTAIREDEKIYKFAMADGILSGDYREKLTNYTRSVAFSNALKKGLKNTNGLMRNLTNSAAAAANRQLSDALDLAYLEVASGAFTPQEAVFKAVKKLGADGIKCVNYKSGRTDQLDVAVRRAIVTGVGKTCSDLQLGLADEMDCQLVEVSSHLGARPSHAEWQGRIYSLVKGHPKYPYFYDATGYGTGDGLCGWNCRHSFFPYFEGLSRPANEPTFSRAENAQVYADTQKQRGYERAIRKSKRELAALDGARSAENDPAAKAKYDGEFARKSAILKRQEARLSEHLKVTGLLPDNSRVRVDGFGKSVSQKAVWASKKQINYAKATDIFDFNSNSSNINISPEQVYTELSTSPIGVETIEYLKRTNIKPMLSYAPRYDGVRGDQLDDEIRIFMRNVKNSKVAAQTVIHEVTHHRYGIGKSQWAEAVCMAHEKMHITGRNYLTISEKRYIVGLARKAYPEFKWRKGGYVNGEK